MAKRFETFWLLFLLSLLWVISDGIAFGENETIRKSAELLIHFGEITPPVVAQQNITVRAPVSNQQTEDRPLECSGLAWLDGHLLISSDRHQHLLFSCKVDIKEMAIGTPQPEVVVRNEQDLLDDVESITLLNRDGIQSLYMLCSLSNAPNEQPLPQRRQMLRCRIKSVSPFEMDYCEVQSMGTLRQQLEVCFESIRVQPYHTYYADYPGNDKNTYRWGNVEGITFAPDGKTLLCGLRNPLYAQRAIAFAVDGIEPATEPMVLNSVKVTDFFLLDLGNRGISDLSWDPLTQGYLITAGKSNGPRLDPDQPYPPNSLDSALFWWSGQKSDAPVIVARIPDMTIEAVCRLGTSRYIALGSDEGDVSEGRTARQSIITILEFTGIPQ